MTDNILTPCHGLMAIQKVLAVTGKTKDEADKAIIQFQKMHEQVDYIFGVAVGRQAGNEEPRC